MDSRVITRTYRRCDLRAPSPPLSILISNAAERCRLCLSYSDSLHPIFESNDTITLPARIYSCLSVLVVQNKHLPVNICSKCTMELERYYEFRKKCQLNDQRLKKHLQMAILNEKAEQHRQLENINKHEKAVSEGSKVSCEISNITKNFQPTEIKKYNLQEIETNLSMLVHTALVCSGAAKPSTVHSVNTPSPEARETGAISFTPGPVSERTLEVAMDAPLTLQLYTKDNAVITMQLEEEEAENDDAAAVISLPTASVPMPTEHKEDIRCLYCPDITFKNPNVLQAHMALHNMNRGAVCGICQRWFERSSSLARHMSVHTGERRHTCDKCEKRFRTKDILNRHKLIHLEKRPYACESCDKSFTQPGALRAHAQSHVLPSRRALRLISCPLCTKTFCHPSGLTRHMKYHTGRRYPCRLCERIFTDQSALRRHVNTLHDKRTDVKLQHSDIAAKETDIKILQSKMRS